MKAAILISMTCMAAPLAACSQGGNSSNQAGNAAVIPADQAEQELMANGYSGERSSGQPATGESGIGTTGQSNVSGEAPAGATGSGTKDVPDRSRGGR